MNLRLRKTNSTSEIISFIYINIINSTETASYNRKYKSTPEVTPKRNNTLLICNVYKIGEVTMAKRGSKIRVCMCDIC